MSLENIILKPIVSEKSSVITETNNSFGFYVSLKANKYQIKDAVESLYDVKVLNVRTMVMPGKIKRAGKHLKKTSKSKKAFVQLSDGQKIEFFKGI